MKLLAALFAFFCLVTPALAAPTFPALSGRVVDNANILSAATKSDLDEKSAALEAKTSRQLVVVTLPSLQGYDIADYGYQLGRAWGIGQAKLNNGLILIIAPTEHKARIEVGYGLEPIVTDALSSVILQTDVLPKFRSGDFNGGVEAGVDALVQQLSLDPSKAEAKAAAAAQQAHDGGGQQSGGITSLIIFLFIAFAIARVFGGWGFLPFLFMGGFGGGRGGGDGGGGGGSFGGGGGSFGGGGASGSW